LPFDGASFEHRHRTGLAAACPTACPCASSLRSPRPGVSPSCP